MIWYILDYLSIQFFKIFVTYSDNSFYNTIVPIYYRYNNLYNNINTL